MNLRFLWALLANDKTTSVIALFVAAVALVVAIYEARVTRTHHELSVWPHITYFNTSVVEEKGMKFNFGSYIKNNGVGPALVKSISIKLEDKEYDNMIQLFRTAINDNNIDGMKTDKSVIQVVQPGEKILLAGVNLDNQQKVKLFNNELLEKAVIKFCYCSLYNNCFSLTTGEKPKEIKRCL